MLLFSLGAFFLLVLFQSGILCSDIDETYWREFKTVLRVSSVNHTKFGCIWRPNNNAHQCPDPDVNFYYYSGYGKKKISPKEKNTLTETRWDPHKDNIVYIHGYGGGDGIFPNYILRDAYIRNGTYNIFVVDWGPLAKLPCYISAVNNLIPVAKCTAQLYKNIRSQGVSSNRITCVGHSLGAHVCGLVSKYLNFRMHRIIGLDPAGPMVPNSSRLRKGMADSVQVMHTNAGTFGESTSGGRVNFCINGGKSQPICNGTVLGSDLCSHIVSVCYMAESIDGSAARKAQPCSRQCPYGPRRNYVSGFSVLFGQHTPDKASGSFCFHSNEPPYCPKANNSNGDPWCCLDKRAAKKLKKLGNQWNMHKPKKR